MIAVRKRFLLIALLASMGFIALGMGLVEYQNMDWAGSPNGNMTPISIKRSVFGHRMVLYNARRYSGNFSQVFNGTEVYLQGTWEGPKASTLGGSVIVSGDDRAIGALGGGVGGIPFGVVTWEGPRSPEILYWNLYIWKDRGFDSLEAVRFSTPNPGHITKSNGNISTSSIQNAPPLAVKMDQVVTTEVRNREARPTLVWSDWQSFEKWVLEWGNPYHAKEPSPSESTANFSWSTQQDWMPVADCVCPNFGPAFQFQDHIKDGVLHFHSVLWPEDGPYTVSTVFGHFHEVAGLVILSVPSSGEMPLHQHYSWGNTSVELVSIRPGQKGNYKPPRYEYPQLVMRLKAAGLVVRENSPDGFSNLVPVAQPLNPGKSLGTPGNYPFILFSQPVVTSGQPSNSQYPAGNDCFKTSLPDQPVEVSCNIETNQGDPVTFSFILMDEVRRVHFGVTPKVEK